MKKTKLIFVIALMMIFIFIINIFLLNILINQKENNAVNNTASNFSVLGKSVALSLEEVSKHNVAQNCWLLINNKIYDVTTYINSHPGGMSEIIRGCGKDATILFNTQGNAGASHSSSANALLNSFYIGDLNQEVTSSYIDNKISSINNSFSNKNIEIEDEEEDD